MMKKQIHSKIGISDSLRVMCRPVAPPETLEDEVKRLRMTVKALTEEVERLEALVRSK